MWFLVDKNLYTTTSNSKIHVHVTPEYIRTTMALIEVGFDKVTGHERSDY